MWWLLAETEFVAWAPLTLGMLLLIVILLRRIYRRQGRRRGPRPGSPNRKSHATRNDSRDKSPLLDAPPDLTRWHVEIHDVARDMKAELDSKMVALQTLINAAQQETARLEATLFRAQRTSAGVGVAGRLASGEPEVEGQRPQPSGLPGTKRQRRDAYRLADLGHPTTAIADFIGTSVGDVDLMLGCRGRDDS